MYQHILQVADQRSDRLGRSFFLSQEEGERTRSDQVRLPSEIEATGTMKQAAPGGGNAPKPGHNFIRGDGINWRGKLRNVFFINVHAWRQVAE